MGRGKNNNKKFRRSGARECVTAVFAFDTRSFVWNLDQTMKGLRCHYDYEFNFSTFISKMLNQKHKPE